MQRAAVLLSPAHCTLAPCVASTSGRPPRAARAARPHGRPLACLVRAQVAGAAQATRTPPPAITLTDAALAHLHKLREESGGDVLLRMGVKSGGCSGMSYFMEFESEENLRPDDAVMQYEGGFKLACDPKSLLYLFGMRLDYSNQLIGGGFQFHNPNAESSCGCGKSFGV